METKVCSTCGRELPVDKFNKCSKSQDGLQTRCKECQKKANADYYKRKYKGLESYSAFDLVEEIKKRFTVVMVDPSPRDAMEFLKSQGYSGQLQVTRVETIDLSRI